MGLRKKAYILSGLGVDSRAFRNIDFEDLDVVFIDWIAPEDGESIARYAKRISATIDVPNPMLIGLSFGGMVAVEIAKTMVVEKLILISSAKTRHEIPMVYRLFGKLKLHKLVPASFLKHSSFMSTWLFGAQTADDEKLLKEILKETDSQFLYWAIDKIVCWKNMELPSNYAHIHGDNDRILPIKNIEADYEIRTGGHFMIVNRSKEISLLIQKVISDVQ